jgi:alcohol dehydrogenase
MAEASVIAGMAFTLPKTTSSHACSFPLTNLYHIPHGEACGLTLDYFARVNAKALGVEGERINGFAKQLGFFDMTEMADAIAELKRDINLRCDMKDFDLTDEAVEELVCTSHHPNMLNNPVEITDEILRDMYNSYR